MAIKRQPLLDSQLDRILSQMRTAPQAAAPDVPFGASRDFITFESHPLYRQMAFQRDLGSRLGFQDPHYRIHVGAAGAATSFHGIERINFASYDYLNLNRHPLILEAVERAGREFGTSVSASRMTAGERRIHGALEAALASLYEAEAAIAFVSGHGGIVSTLATLMGPRDLILHDVLSHNCIVMGARLSGAARRSFAHNDLGAIEAILANERDRFERVLIVCEGLFSMDGDGPDLPHLIELKKRHGAIFMVDDAHGLGVLGRTGRGIFEHQDVNPGDVDLWVGTLSKALVSCGGYVAGSAVVIDLLKHHAPGFVYSVGLPAGVAVTKDATRFRDMVRILGITHIHLHHTLGADIPAIRVLHQMLESLELPIDVTLHDYFFICPRATLIDGSGRYCGEPAPASCNLCIAKNGSMAGVVSIAAWRAAHLELLSRARRIFVPGEDMRARMQAYFPDLPYLVREHWLDPVSPLKRRGRKLTGAFVMVGAIGPHKGSEVLLALATAARTHAPHLKFIVIGYSNIDEKLRSVGNVLITGEYREAELRDLIKFYDPDAILNLSTWPETYCYTFHETLQLGVYPITFDIGAPSITLNKLGWGSILPLSLGEDGEALLKAVLAIDTSRVKHNFKPLQIDQYRPLREFYYDLEVSNPPSLDIAAVGE